jgi:hypothetical protein
MKHDTDIQQIFKEFFNKIEKTEVQSEPFKHLIVDNILPNDFYKDLAKELSDEDFYNNYQKGPYGPLERFGVDITDYDTWVDGDWRLCIPTKVHPNNYDKLLDRNLSYIGAFIKLLLENHKDFYSLLCSKFSTERGGDEYFFHLSMVKDKEGYKIDPHTDDEQNIFSILLYTPETDANKEFGLDVYKDAGSEITKGRQMQSIEMSERRRIDTPPNRVTLEGSDETPHSPDRIIIERASREMIDIPNKIITECGQIANFIPNKITVETPRPAIDMPFDRILLESDDGKVNIPKQVTAKCGKIIDLSDFIPVSRNRVSMRRGKTIEFIPNRMVVFAPSKPNSDRPATWHAVRRISDKIVGTRNSFQMFFVRATKEKQLGQMEENNPYGPGLNLDPNIGEN